MKKKRFFKVPKIALKSLRNFLILLLIFCILGISFLEIESRFDSPQELSDKIKEFGILGPLAVILLITLEVIVAPIPGGFIAIASGFAFGTYAGTLYSYLGNVIGTFLAFMIARKLGRPFVENLISSKKMNIYDSFFKEYGKIILWLSFLFPVMPSDMISLVAGVSNVKLKDFMLIVSIAYLPNMFLLNRFGSSLYSSGISNESIIIGSIMVSFLLFGTLIYFYLKKKTSNSLK